MTDENTNIEEQNTTVAQVAEEEITDVEPKPPRFTFVEDTEDLMAELANLVFAPLKGTTAETLRDGLLAPHFEKNEFTKNDILAIDSVLKDTEYSLHQALLNTLTQLAIGLPDPGSTADAPLKLLTIAHNSWVNNLTETTAVESADQTALSAGKMFAAMMTFLGTMKRDEQDRAEKYLNLHPAFDFTKLDTQSAVIVMVMDSIGNTMHHAANNQQNATGGNLGTAMILQVAENIKNIITKYLVRV